MVGETSRTYVGKCIDCDSKMELFEIDYEKGRKIMQCTSCGLYHFYKRTFFDKWKLVKAGRVSEFWKK
ncbi:MAG: hypothetical protein PVH12_06850 [Candidatus Bathyarchaeota archaeon]|jgi:hypothetical protein